MLKAIGSSFVSVLPESLKQLFGIIDKAVVDKDKANELKFSLASMIVGKDAQHWLPANAFTIVMLCNYFIIAAMYLFNRPVPFALVFICITWAAGPLLNTLSKETVKALMELAHGYMEWQTERKASKAVVNE